MKIGKSNESIIIIGSYTKHLNQLCVLWRQIVKIHGAGAQCFSGIATADGLTVP